MSLIFSLEVQLTCIGLGLPACPLCGLVPSFSLGLHHRHKKEVMFWSWASFPAQHLKKGASEKLIKGLADCPGLLLSLQIELRTVWRALPSMANEEDDPVIQEVTVMATGRRTKSFLYVHRRV